jgi:hypothetical protein
MGLKLINGTNSTPLREITWNVDHLLLIKVCSSKIKKKIIFLVEATFENANGSKENIVIRDT